MQENVRLLSVAEAAAALGVSTDAIRKRLARGTIEGEKVDGQWQVFVPVDAPDTDAPVSDTRRASDQDTSGQTSEIRTADLQATIEDLRARLDWAQGEQSDLRSTLADVITQAADDRRRADTLQAMNQRAQDRIRELEALTAGHAGDIEAVGSTESDETPSTGISTTPETGGAPGGMWQRVRRWLSGQ